LRRCRRRNFISIQAQKESLPPVRASAAAPLIACHEYRRKGKPAAPAMSGQAIRRRCRRLPPTLPPPPPLSDPHSNPHANVINHWRRNSEALPAVLITPKGRQKERKAQGPLVSAVSPHFRDALRRRGIR